MPDFYKQYRFKDTNNPVESWDQFLNIRVGARLIKDTGDEYQKMSETNVYDKVPRYFLSNEDIEDKFALLHDTNIFTDPQFVTCEPTEPYHITNKEYVDSLVASSQVDLSGFARLDRENIWEKAQICNSEPMKRTHLTNKGYVDDRINEIEFDTTSLAKLNSANVFTAPQSVTVPSTDPRHLVSKKYVDDIRDSIVNNITGFVRSDLPNVFTATQTFQATTIVPEPKRDEEAANKLYVDTKVSETSSSLGNFAALDLKNVFEKDQTFRDHAICDSTPTQPYHLVNKEYVDGITSGSKLPDGVALLNKAQVWLEKQDFSEGLTVPEPVDNNNPATKNYVDRIAGESTPQATTDVFGIVKLTQPISKLDQTPEGMQSIKDFENNSTTVTTPKDVSIYVKSVKTDMGDFAGLKTNNIFTGTNTFNELAAFKDINATGDINAMNLNVSNRTIVRDLTVNKGLAFPNPSDETPLIESRFTTSANRELTDAVNVTIKNHGNMMSIERKSVATGGQPAPVGSLFYPEFEKPSTIELAQDFSISADGDSAGTYYGLNVGIQEVFHDDEDDEDYVGVGDTSAFIGIKSDGRRLYPATNIITAYNNDDCLVSVEFIKRSPNSHRMLRSITLDAESSVELGDDVAQINELMANYYNTGSAKINGEQLSTLSKSLEGNLEINSNGTVKACTLDCDKLDTLTLKFDEGTIDELTLNCCRRIITESNVPVLNIQCSNIIVHNEFSGTINASYNSQVILKGPNAKTKVNATNGTTVIKLKPGNVSEIVVDDSSKILEND